MIIMTQITILDTGYNTSDRQGTAKTGSDINSPGSYIANGGAAITLNCESLKMVGGTNLTAEPNPSSNNPAETSFNTFNNDTYTVPFKLDARSATDRALLKEINVLRKTVGVKLLYSSDTASSLKITPEIIGRTDTKFHGNEITTGIPTIVCRVSGISIDFTSKSNKYALSGKLTIIEEKVVPA